MISRLSRRETEFSKMAESSEGDELPRCSTLFLTEDGSQMHFYMTPCAMKTRLRPLITDGGGHLSSKVLTDSIKLAAPGTGSNLSGYISTDYIFDSIKHNKLQDMEKYKMKPSDARVHVTSSKCEKNSKCQVPVSTVKVSAKTTKRHGRHKYTHAEDLALMKFVQEHFDCCPMKGNAVYKKAEMAQITDHSWQSMRDHYIKVLYKRKGNKQYSHFFVKGKHPKSSSSPDEKKNEKKEETKKASLSRVVKVQGRITRAQVSKVKDKSGTNNKSTESDDADISDDTSGDNTADQQRVTRAQASKVKEKTDSKNKHDVSEDMDDSSAGTGNEQESITRAKTSKVKETIHSKNKHGAKDYPQHPNADPLGDVASTDNIIDDVSSAAEDVDYDKLFDENLLKQAYESKKKDSREVDRDSTNDEGAAEENRVSSSQETVKKLATKRQKTPTKEQEKLSDFAGEVVFREDLKSPSRKLEYDEEDSEDKRPLAKRSKQDLESSPDDENPSEKERKHEEAFLKYYQALRSNLQKLQAELTVEQIIHALLVSSGRFDDAEDYIQNGTGKEQWTSKEDKILLSKNKGEIASLAKKRGLNAVVDRMNFMEGIN